MWQSFGRMIKLLSNKFNTYWNKALVRHQNHLLIFLNGLRHVRINPRSDITCIVLRILYVILNVTILLPTHCFISTANSNEISPYNHVLIFLSYSLNSSHSEALMYIYAIPK